MIQIMNCTSKKAKKWFVIRIWFLNRPFTTRNLALQWLENPVMLCVPLAAKHSEDFSRRAHADVALDLYSEVYIYGKGSAWNLALYCAAARICRRRLSGTHLFITQKLLHLSTWCPYPFLCLYLFNDRMSVSLVLQKFRKIRGLGFVNQARTRLRIT